MVLQKEKVVAPNITDSLVQFEEGYIFMENRSITSTPDVAITEFVANAWDAGAYNVSIVIPNEEGDVISIEDDGSGMSDTEFRQIWMKLRYNRQKNHRAKAEFPADVEQRERFAYGRNGVGRHGMFCFSNYYTVETWKNGICNKYDIMLSSGDSPYKIANTITYDKQGHGTKISAFVNRNLPDEFSMTDIISARFLYDPNFIVKINGKQIDLLSHKGICEEKEIVLDNNEKLNLIIIDSSKTALKSQQNGIAFWICGRLVGRPSWVYGDVKFLKDGRCSIAKRYTLIIQTAALIDDVLPDWTGFYNTPKMNKVYSKIKSAFNDFVTSIMTEQIEELQSDVIKDNQEELEKLSISGQRDVSVFIEMTTQKDPMIDSDFLKNAVESVIKIEQAKKGEKLLNQLCQMSAEEIDKLSDLLSEWNVNDILSVINEVDKRILVVEAIDRIFNDKKTDELHTLHPLVLNARWLFGAEFDSPMFVSNSALSTVVKKLFKDEDYDLCEIANPLRRPDIVCLKKSTFRAVCTDRPDEEADGIMKPDQVLLIELKRGGFNIEANEVTQAEHYVRQIRNSRGLHRNATITAFVVGATIGDVDDFRKTSSGKIHVSTYGHLVETANKKLFGLREQLKTHYKEIGDESIVEKALKHKQLTME